MTPALAHRRRYCQENPDMPMTLLGRELLELLDILEDLRRQRVAAREHLERRHGCTGECHGTGGE